MADFKDLTEMIVAFRNQRNWKQFHKPKDMAISLALEATEVLEHFQWKNDQEAEEYLRGGGITQLGEELADVLYWVLLLAHDLEIDLDQAFRAKMRQNDAKYPIEKSKDRYLKYDRL